MSFYRGQQVRWETYTGRRRGIGRVLHCAGGVVRVQVGASTVTLDVDHGDQVEEFQTKESQ